MARFNIELSVTGAANTNKALSSVNREATSLEKGYQRLQSTIRDLSAQQGNLQTSMQRLNVAFKSGRISEAQFTKQSDKLSLELSDVAGKIQQAQSRLTSYNATMKQATDASRSFGTANKQLQGYSNDFTSGIRSSNAVAIEFSRIIQDAPYGIQGVANNLQQLTQNYAYYTRSVREAAAAQGRTVTTGALVKGALGSLLSPINLLTLGISAVTAGWVAYERWQQRANKSAKDGKTEFELISEAAQKYAKTLSLVNQAQLNGLSNSDDERIRLSALRTVIEDNNVSMGTRLKAIKDLRSEFPGYFKDITNETLLNGNASTSYENLTRQIIATEQARANASKLAESSTSRRALEQQLYAEKEIGQAAYDRAKQLEAIIEAETTIEGRTQRNIQYRDEINRLQDAYQKSAGLINENEQQLIKLVEEEKNLIDGINSATKTSIELFVDKKNGADATGKSLKNQLDIISKINDVLRSQQEESILAEKSGLDKTIQSIRFQYDALERAADEYRQQTEDAFKQGNISAQQYQANLAAIEAYLQRIGRFEVGAVGRAIRPTISPVDTLRAQSPADRLNRGPSSLPSVNLQTQQPVITPDFDLSLITQGLKRASRQFINNMSSSLEWLHRTETKRFGDYLLGIGQSLFSSFDSIINNTLANQLEDMIQGVFDDIKKGVSGGADWSKIGQLGVGLGGQLIQGATKKTNVLGQTLGGLASGAGTGFAAGGWVGAIVGGIIGGLSGLFSASAARRQEKLQEQQLEQQKKQTALMERQAALAYTSQIIGQMTSQGLVQGVSRNEFGDIVFRIQGRDLVGVINKEEAANMRGV